jgi:uncharacterized membrane protein YadS
VLETAAVTKLLRNAFMIVVIPATTWWHQRGAASRSRVRVRFTQAVPWFVIGFLALAVVRTLADLNASAIAQPLIQSGLGVSTACLGVAMAAIGLGTDLRKLRGLGLRPLAVGFAAALTTGAVATAVIKLTA